ncbi:MAG: hypothetical protein GX363_03750 [Clostridiales bacterium]|nr:hypothetical protein [Clostridiales bacterium]
MSDKVSCKILVYALILFLVLGIPVFTGKSDFVYGAENIHVKIEQTGGYFAVQDDKNVALKVRVTNNSDDKIVFSPKTNLSQTDGNLTEPKPNSGTISLEPSQSTELVFSIDVKRYASVGSHTITVLLVDEGSNKGDILRSKNVSISISQKTTTPPAEYEGNYMAAADLVHAIRPQSSIVAGIDNELVLTFTNKGNTVMKDTKVTLSLPDGIFINNSSSTLSVGYMNVGTTKTVVFPLTADTNLDSKNYPINIRIDFFDKTNSPNSIEQTLYIPVQSGGSASIKDLAITNISIPEQVNKGENFTLTFQVTNNGTHDTGELRIYTEANDGLVNRTKNIFIEQSIKKGESKSYSVSYFSLDDAISKNYPIKIAVEPSSQSGDQVVQYTGVFIDDGGMQSVNTPQLMVSDYSFGGSFVQAGDEFRLNIGLTNTSSSHNLQNIKVTLDSVDGTFIPVRSSNSFFIDSIEKNGYKEHGLFLSVKPDAEQKTTSVNINMTYEDRSGNTYNATDVISIPVMQETRLVVDDIIAPPELYAGMQNGVNVEFYNMGKTTLNNLRVSAEGDFDTMESTSYYVGNMESGRSDSYNFSFIPRGAGQMEGKLVFRYEDASGNEQLLEKEFSFEIMDMPVWNDDFMPIEEFDEGQSSVPWYVILIIIVVVAVGVIVFLKKRRKKKMDLEMDLNE